MYQLIANSSCILRLTDGVSFPADPTNSDYVAYLAWVAEGNAPLPAPGKDALAQIADLEATITPRRVREALLGVDNGWLAGVDAQIAALRASL